MDGFNWLVIVPLLVLCLTIVALVKFFPSNRSQKECNKSPLLCFADSNNGSKRLGELIKEGDEKVARESGNCVHKNGVFKEYIR